MKIGSLFSGYAGLEQGVQAVLGGDVAWHSEIDPGACKILAHRYPDVPNIGDITSVDWTAVEPVDVLTGGFPCQDVSCAGLRQGLRPDTRSGLWTQMAYAIDQLRPGLVVVENVRGLLSAEAHSDLEPCPWCVGDGGGVPLRALGAVLGDLADIGYDASWQGLRAADVGAPHGRFRVFVVAWPAAGDSDLRDRHWRPAAGQQGEAGPAVGCAEAAQDPDLTARRERRIAAPGQAKDRRARAHAGGRGGAPATHAHNDAAGPGRESGHAGQCRAKPAQRDPAAHANGDAVRQQPVALTGRRGATVTGLPGADAAGHAGSDRREGCTERHERPTGWIAAPQRDDADGCGHAVADTDPGGWGANLADLRAGQPDTHWGPYGDAVRRWERLTRPAPAPTERGKNGRPRLSPAFVEWMQGLPAGWVTDVPGLSRNEQLKALGNGVVPQQAAQALRMLLPDVARAAA